MREDSAGWKWEGWSFTTNPLPVSRTTTILQSLRACLLVHLQEVSPPWEWRSLRRASLVRSGEEGRKSSDSVSSWRWGRILCFIWSCSFKLSLLSRLQCQKFTTGNQKGPGQRWLSWKKCSSRGNSMSELSMQALSSFYSHFLILQV